MKTYIRWIVYLKKERHGELGWNTIKILPIHGCVSINRQLTSPTENNFAGKRSMECKQNKDA